jgi:hypothetical protein
LFDHRLGLALGKSIAEIHRLPYPEYKSWQLFHMIEPWGFADREYRTAALMAQMYNVRVQKRSQAKKVTVWMRDTHKQVLAHLRRMRAQANEEMASPDIDLTTEEGRREATQRVVSTFKAMFGNRLKHKDK